MDNPTLAQLFDELADLLEIAGENPFKMRAYRTFAQKAREHAEPLAVIAARGELQALPGVGKAIAAKVDLAIHTGTFPALERARAAVPESVRGLLHLPGLSPKLVRTLWRDSGIHSLAELAFALEEGRLKAVAGFSAKHRARVLAAVDARLREATGVLLATAVATTRAIDALLREAGALEVVPVGATRRGVEIVRDLVVLVRGIDPARVAPILSGAATLDGALATPAADGATLVVHRLPTRVRVVPDAEWVHALFTETGDEAHLAWLASRATPDLRTVCREQPTEADVYRALGLTPVPPELREGGGERVPQGLLEPADVRGFFHVHTDWSDGTAPILAMASAAARSGYGYIGISDHSRAASYANGLDPARLSEQAKAIAIARREQSSCRILHGVEVDILPDGALDLADEDLASLDFVIASVHVSLSMSEEEMTARLVRAVSHPLVTILGHPTGRLLLGRRGYAFDLGAVARAAAANDTYLEINANAQRLDLSEEHIRRAAREGARFAIDPDAHADHAVEDTVLGVMIARRAGLTRDQVLNAKGGDEIESVLSARKARALARLSSASRGL